VKIVVVDYGICNVQSIINALSQFEDVSVVLSDRQDEILSADGLILPGVGAFKKAMEELNFRNLPSILNNYNSLKKPFLGICLGMQLLFESSEEFGNSNGLGFVKGVVKSFPKSISDKLPHVSWNNLIINESNLDNNILNGITADDDFYFVHSYICHPKSSDAILATTSYGGVEFCSVFQHNNIYGCQFHPEKSASQGLRILNNFIDIASK
jgi:glutamine amidotransferase